MKLINAYWDTRSLGVSCAEIEFDYEDDDRAVERALDFAEPYDYVVAKVPSGRVIDKFLLQEHGFKHIEALIEVTIALGEVRVPPLVARFEQRISSHHADEEESCAILDRIRRGIFDTDRIYLDSFFSHEQAAGRYVNWILDALGRGAELHQVLYKGEEVGFFVYDERIAGVEAYPFLAGLYTEWRTSGLGTNVVVLAPLREAQRRGCKRIKTYVSSNNQPILRAHESLGFRVTDMRDVLVRHAGGATT